MFIWSHISLQPTNTEQSSRSTFSQFFVGQFMLVDAASRCVACVHIGYIAKHAHEKNTYFIDFRSFVCSFCLNLQQFASTCSGCLVLQKKEIFSNQSKNLRIILVFAFYLKNILMFSNNRRGIFVKRSKETFCKEPWKKIHL